jgi:peroxiredoxin Q/BCP
MKKKLTFKNIVIVFLILFFVGGFILEITKNNAGGGSSTLAKGAVFQSLVGKPAPAFTLTDAQGNTITNDSLKGKKVLLFFNEGLACYPACWNQMTEFSKDDRFKKDDTVVLSVVTDSKTSWQQAASKNTDLATVNVAFDTGGASRDFGATNVASTMHPGQAGHSYVIIDKDGIVRYVFDDPRMAVNNGEMYAHLAKLK